MQTRLKIAGVIGIAACVLAPQTQPQSPPPAQPLAVSIVRPTICPADALPIVGGAVDSRNGAAAYSNWPARQLIAQAYSLQPMFVVGGPGWLDTERFDVYFRAGHAMPQAAMSAALQSVLADRLGLATHREQKPMPAYLLRMGSGKPLLKPSTGGDASPGCKPESSDQPETAGLVTYTCLGATIADLLNNFYAGGYTNEAGEYFPVTDATGLTDKYDFKLKFRNAFTLRRPSDPAYDPNVDISLFDAVDKQLGLKLERTVQPAPVLIVDHIHETPAPNPPGVSSDAPVMPTEFEVATIRPSGPDTSNATFSDNRFLPSGEVFLYGRTLESLIESVYDLNGDDSVLQAPGWLNSDKWDFEAKSPLPIDELTVDATATQCAAGNAGPRATMWRNLLAQRFKLAVHTDVRPIRVFALVAVKNGRLKPAAATTTSRCDEGTPVGGRRITCTNTTMAQLAEWFDAGNAGGYTEGRHVVDMTGLKGGYDFTFSFVVAAIAKQNAARGGADGAVSDPTGQQDLFEALQSQLGLNLVERQHPMPVLVIDHVERTPTVN